MIPLEYKILLLAWYFEISYSSVEKALTVLILAKDSSAFVEHSAVASWISFCKLFSFLPKQTAMIRIGKMHPIIIKVISHEMKKRMTVHPIDIKDPRMAILTLLERPVLTA